MEEEANIMINEEIQSTLKQEVAGLGIGTSFDNTQELHTITYRRAMRSPDKDIFQIAIEEEYMKMVNPGHLVALHWLFKHHLATKEGGLVMQPKEKWDRTIDFLFETLGMSDSNLPHMWKTEKAY